MWKPSLLSLEYKIIQLSHYDCLGKNACSLFKSSFVECYSAIKRNDSDTCYTLDGPQENYAKYKKVVVQWLRGFPGDSDGKESACNSGDSGSIPGLGRSPGKGMATNSNILAWKILWTEEPGGLQFMGLLNNNNNQWLKTHFLMQGTWVQSLVGELRAHVPWGN